MRRADDTHAFLCDGRLNAWSVQGRIRDGQRSWPFQPRCTADPQAVPFEIRRSDGPQTPDLMHGVGVVCTETVLQLNGATSYIESGSFDDVSNGVPPSPLWLVVCRCAGQGHLERI